MSETSSAAPTFTADPQDPLPESTWFWRRTFVFLLSAALLAGVWFKVDDVARVALNGSETAIDGLVDIIKLCLVIVAGVMTYYLVAPSAEQVTRMLATVSAWKAGVSTSTQSRVDTEKGSAQTRTTAGLSPPLGSAEPATDLPDYAR